MAGNRQIQAYMSLMSGDDFMHFRLPLTNANLQFQLMHCISEAYSRFLLELTPDDTDLAEVVEKGMEDIARFRERLLVASFHNAAGRRSALDGVPEGTEEGGETQLRDLKRPLADTKEKEAEEEEDEETLELKREIPIHPHDNEAAQKIATQALSIHEDAEACRSDAGSASEEQQPESPMPLHLLQLSMKPMGFDNIIPTQPEKISWKTKASSQVREYMKKVRVPKLGAWHVSSRKISPEQSESQSSTA